MKHLVRYFLSFSLSLHSLPFIFAKIAHVQLATRLHFEFLLRSGNYEDTTSLQATWETRTEVINNLNNETVHLVFSSHLPLSSSPFYLHKNCTQLTSNSLACTMKILLSVGKIKTIQRNI